jgi:membrane protein implicated in regulation of membrane protease activity
MDIFGNGVSLGNGSVQDSWSLLSLILSLIALISALVLIVRGVAENRRRNENEADYDEHHSKYNEQELQSQHQSTYKRTLILRLLTIVAGVLTPVVWLLLDKLSKPMVLINANTVFIALIFIVFAAFLVIYLFTRHQEVVKQDDQYLKQEYT